MTDRVRRADRGGADPHQVPASLVGRVLPEREPVVGGDGLRAVDVVELVHPAVRRHRDDPGELEEQRPDEGQGHHQPGGTGQRAAPPVRSGWARSALSRAIARFSST